MVDTFDAAVTTWEVGACRKLHRYVCKQLSPAGRSLFPVTVAVTQHGVKGFSCAAGVVIRGCDRQDSGRYGREWSNSGVGGDRLWTGRGITTQWDRGA